jgi:hypothetical protein
MADVAYFLTLALQAVSARVTVLVSMSMSFGLYCWAMWMGTPLAVGTACAFAILVFLPVLWRGHGKPSKDGAADQ